MRRILILVGFLFFLDGCSGCGDNGNKDQPDGGPDGSVEEVCEVLPPTANTCDVAPGDGRKLIKGNVLTPGKVFRGGQVAVDAAGQITCVGCDCAAGGETVVTCADAVISPGLINTHDHITFTQNPPYTDGGVRYEHRHQWRRGQDGKPRISSAGGATADQIRWGELRFLMGGATSIVGSGGQAGLLRNLDSNNQEGLGQGAVNFDTFPLDDSSGTRLTSGCAYGGSPTTAASIMSNDAYEPHTAEGIDTSARNEFLCESSETYDPGRSQNLLIAKTAMIHGIGLTAQDYGAMAAANTALIWSPRSNITLYGETARVTTAARLGVEIALGTDWMPTGSMNLLRELRCADSMNKTYYNNFFSDEALWMMVTANAAAVTATDDAIGVLKAGLVADIAIFKGNGKTFRAVIDAEPQDVTLVLRAGKALYGDATIVNALAQNCDAVDVCGSGKSVCMMAEVAKTYEQLKSSAGANIYPAFVCGPPMNEPTCTPKRPEYTGIATADDSDGDGVANASDKCPNVFDPIRPMDNGMQTDTDGDGEGDACDVCPFDADSTMCTVADPNDRDGDGVGNATDNCPDTANPDQADSDADQKGDACDACPGDSNPGATGCPKTIYQIKNNMVPLGTLVVVDNALVTGRGSNGFFVQVKEGDAGYTGADFSGMFVFTGTAAPVLANATVGARVRIAGRVANFQGQLELDQVSAVTVIAVGPEAPPAPIAATYAEVTTGGTRATALEGVIVSLGPSAVSGNNPMFSEYTVADGATMMIVSPFLFVPTPLPSAGETFVSMRGIVALRNMASKLLPRDAGDLTVGSPGIAAFGPALSYARVGVTNNAPTFPTPLEVRLTAAPAAPVTVVITSPSGDLSVANVTIPAGSVSAPVPVTANAQNATPITLTATLGVQVRQANVRVLGAAEVPTTVTLDPPTAGVSVGGTVTMTVSLDLPAPAGGSTVTLAVNPPSAGTLPASVLVPADQTSATFVYMNMLTTGSAMVTATFGASSDTSTISVATGPNHLVLRQIYGGGGNSGAPFNRDFVELFNPSQTPFALAGLSVQYGSAMGTTWLVTPLPAGATIPPGGSYLVALASGATGAPLPTPDATGSTNMSATAGKVALVDGTNALTNACPTTNIIDLVGYGTTNCFETDEAPAGSNTNSITRAMGGCTDNDNNSAEFTAGAPVPRNSASPAAPCL
jgi:cytosine/adenosine deaminase-related metal-dependent hydrolase